MLKSLYLLLRGFLPERKGQISDRHEVGRWIKFLASLEDNSVILEIGTWNGLGTSKVIAQGVNQRANQEKVQVFGLEANQKLFKKAKLNLKGYVFYSVIWGTIVTIDQLDSNNLSKVEEEWLKQDTEDLLDTPFVLEKIPSEIDLLILDGGEFSTYAEYDILKNRVSKWLVLDDTNTRKCKRILQEVNADDFFTVIWKSDERNGTAVLLRNR
jgi:hypothetical protein